MNLTSIESKNVETLYTLMNHFEFPITKEFRDNVDWDKVFTIIESYKSTYNENMLRFVKSHLISKSIERYSKGYLKYVNQIGCDFLTPDNVRIELKSGLKMFQKRKQQTVDIVISNTQGQSTDTKVFEKTFDYLLLIEPGMVGITTWEKMRPFVRPKGDCFKAQIPMSEIELFKQTDKIVSFNYNLSDRIEEALDKALDDAEKGMAKLERIAKKWKIEKKN